MVSVLDVARAAALEVGLDPSVLRPKRTRDGSNGVRAIVPNQSQAQYQRAMYLALMSVHGPARLVRCSRCITHRGGSKNPNPACIPVSDAIRGLTCGRAS